MFTLILHQKLHWLKNTGVCEKGDDCMFSHGSEEANEENLGVGCVTFCTEDGMTAGMHYILYTLFILMLCVYY